MAVCDMYGLTGHITTSRLPGPTSVRIRVRSPGRGGRATLVVVHTVCGLCLVRCVHVQAVDSGGNWSLRVTHSPGRGQFKWSPAAPVRQYGIFGSGRRKQMKTSKFDNRGDQGRILASVGPR